MKNPFMKASTKKKYLKIYLYGDSGVGKTYFSLTFPNVAIIDLEGGTDFFSDRFQFHVLDTKSFAEVLEAVNFLEKEKHNFKTLVIDPVTIIWSALQEGRLEFKITNLDRAISGEEKSFFTYKDWGQLKRFYSMLMTKLVNLPMHIILTSRLKDEYEISGNEVTKIGVKPEAEKSTPYVTDIRFRLEVDRNKKRIAIFEKDRTGHFDRGTKIQNPSYATFQSLIEENEQDNQKPHAIHQDDNDAVQKDAEFFEQQETQTKPNKPKDKSNGNGNGHKKPEQTQPQNEQGNGLSIGKLFHKYQQLNIGTNINTYRRYLCRKYKIQDPKWLGLNQLEEQKSLLNNLTTPETMAQFKLEIATRDDLIRTLTDKFDGDTRGCNIFVQDNFDKPMDKMNEDEIRECLKASDELVLAKNEGK